VECGAGRDTEADLYQRRSSLLVRRGKGGRRREVGMNDWGWQELQPWPELRMELAHRAAVLRHQRSDRRPPVGNRGRPRATPTHPGRGRRFAQHQLRDVRAVEMARGGVPLIVVQRQLGHSNLGITSI
jgi:site-specific recombinase XerC